MKKLRILWGILKRTRADHILLSFVLFLLADAAVIRLVEPDIHRYGDALWYCYAVISTAGFGDIVTVTPIGKICSVLLTIYTIFVVAIVTGVVVNFYTQLVEMQQKKHLLCSWISWNGSRSFQKRNWNISRRKSANSVKNTRCQYVFLFASSKYILITGIFTILLFPSSSHIYFPLLLQ